MVIIRLSCAWRLGIKHHRAGIQQAVKRSVNQLVKPITNSRHQYQMTKNTISRPHHDSQI